MTLFIPGRIKNYLNKVLKPGKPRSVPKSCRAISLLPLFWKFFVRLLLQRLMRYLDNIISNTQFSFRYILLLSTATPQGGWTHSGLLWRIDLGLFLDSENALYTVWHDGFSFKLKQHLTYTYCKLLLSYLPNRTYSVKIGNTLSKSNLIKSSVPQGSVLGPYLYLIYTSVFHVQNI